MGSFEESFLKSVIILSVEGAIFNCYTVIYFYCFQRAFLTGLITNKLLCLKAAYPGTTEGSGTPVCKEGAILGSTGG